MYSSSNAYEKNPKPSPEGRGEAAGGDCIGGDEGSSEEYFRLSRIQFRLKYSTPGQ